MPALTVKAVTKALSDYVRPDEDIVAKLNMVMPRLYAMGMWRDLLYDWSIETTNKYFTLPEHADSLLGVMLQDSPVEAQSQWHDYRISGYASDGPTPIFGVVDDGFHEAKEDLVYKAATDVYRIMVDGVAPNYTLPPSGSITVVYGRQSGSEFGEDNVKSYTINLAATSSSGPASVNPDAVSIKSISFADVPEEVRVYAIHQNSTPAGAVTTLAVVKGDGVVRYRRFRFENTNAAIKNVKLLLKRAWQPVQTQDDILYLGNLNAIKHGLLGMLAEDNADLERAQYHWNISRQLLEEELDATRGSAKPKLKINPSGASFYIPNIT
jgi:hypothetical protein